MKIRAYLASFAALTLILGLIGCVCGPALVAGGAFDRLLGMDPAWRRTRAAARHSRCGAWLFALFRFLMRIRLVVDVPAIPPERRGSCIVVSNHQHTLDILLLYEVLRRAHQRDLRWVIKRELARAPVVGYAVRSIGCAVVSRTGSLDDLREIERCAKTADADGGSVIIFPEGTRWTPKRGEDSPFRHLLPPKRRGFLALRKEMPRAPVLSVTVRWERFGAAGKTMYHLASLFGQTLRVAVRLVPAEEASLPGWLEREWTRKDEELAAGASSAARPDEQTSAF